MNQFDFQRAVMASNLDGTSKWILVVIGSHVNWKTGQAAFPSIDTLVKESGFSKATVHRAKLKLVSQGYLVSQRHYNKSNTYLVMIPDSLTMTPTSLKMRLGWSHNEELKDNITDNIKENIKDNNESSNEDSYNLLNIEAEELPSVINNNIWEIFENADKEKARAAAAPRLSTKSNRHNRYNDKRSKAHRTTNTEINQFVEEVGRRRQEEW